MARTREKRKFPDDLGVDQNTIEGQEDLSAFFNEAFLDPETVQSKQPEPQDGYDCHYGIFDKRQKTDGIPKYTIFPGDYDIDEDIHDNDLINDFYMSCYETTFHECISHYKSKYKIDNIDEILIDCPFPMCDPLRSSTFVFMLICVLKELGHRPTFTLHKDLSLEAQSDWKMYLNDFYRSQFGEVPVINMPPMPIKKPRSLKYFASKSLGKLFSHATTSHEDIANGFLAGLKEEDDSPKKLKLKTKYN